MSDATGQLRERLAAISDLRHAAGVLEWDQQTMMPPRGYGGRAEALATLGRVIHEQFVSADTGQLLERAERELERSGLDGDSDAAALVRVARRRYDKSCRVPPELAAELARAASRGHEAWVVARAQSDFSAFAPYLQHNFELARRYVECLPGFENPYDALIDDYEPGLSSVEITRIFSELKAELLPLIAAPRERGLKGAIVCSATFAAIVVGAIVIWLPPGGLSYFWQRTIGFQIHRFDVFSPWALHASLRPIQTALEVVAVLFVLALALFPRKRSLIQVCALAGAVTIAVQLPATHWFYYYIMWFLPFAVVGFLMAPVMARQPAAEPVEVDRLGEERAHGEPALAGV